MEAAVARTQFRLSPTDWYSRREFVGSLSPPDEERAEHRRVVLGIPNRAAALIKLRAERGGDRKFNLVSGAFAPKDRRRSWERNRRGFLVGEVRESITKYVQVD